MELQIHFLIKFNINIHLSVTSHISIQRDRNVFNNSIGLWFLHPKRLRTGVVSVTMYVKVMRNIKSRLVWSNPERSFGITPNCLFPWQLMRMCQIKLLNLKLPFSFSISINFIILFCKKQKLLFLSPKGLPLKKPVRNYRVWGNRERCHVFALIITSFLSGFKFKVKKKNMCLVRVLSSLFYWYGYLYLTLLYHDLIGLNQKVFGITLLSPTI